MKSSINRERERCTSCIKEFSNIYIEEHFTSYYMQKIHNWDCTLNKYILTYLKLNPLRLFFDQNFFIANNSRNPKMQQLRINRVTWLDMNLFGGKPGDKSNWIFWLMVEALAKWTSMYLLWPIRLMEESIGNIEIGFTRLRFPWGDFKIPFSFLISPLIC